MICEASGFRTNLTVLRKFAFTQLYRLHKKVSIYEYKYVKRN